jgi:hypothetical protein
MHVRALLPQRSCVRTSHALQDLGLNQLGVFPPGILTLYGLRVLDVSGNALDELPQGLADMPRLVHVALHGNALAPQFSAALERGVGWRLALLQAPPV